MSNKTPEGDHPGDKIFDPLSSETASSKPYPSPRIQTSYSGPNLNTDSFHLDTDNSPLTSTASHVSRNFRGPFFQEIHIPPTSTTGQTSQENEREESQHTPAWRRLYGTPKSSKLSKRRVTFHPVRPTDQTSLCQNDSSRPLEHLQNENNNSKHSTCYLPPHLPCLTSLDSSSLPKLEQQLSPFIGELNSKNPVWQNIKLREKIAGLQEEKRRADEYSGMYKSLLAEFENFRRVSEAKLEKLESDNMKKDGETITQRAEASRQRKFAEHWEWLYEREVANVVSAQEQLASVKREHSTDLYTTRRSPSPSRPSTSSASTHTLAEHAAVLTGNKEIHDTSKPPGQEIFDSPSPTLHAVQAAQGGSIHANEGILPTVREDVEPLIDIGSDTNSTPSSPQKLELPKLRYSFNGLLEDIFKEVDGAHESNL